MKTFETPSEKFRRRFGFYLMNMGNDMKIVAISYQTVEVFFRRPHVG